MVVVVAEEIQTITRFRPIVGVITRIRSEAVRSFNSGRQALAV